MNNVELFINEHCAQFGFYLHTNKRGAHSWRNEDTDGEVIPAIVTGYNFAATNGRGEKLENFVKLSDAFAYAKTI